MPETDDTTDTSGAIELLGPIDYFLVEFSGDKTVGKGLPVLLDLVDRRIIRVFDLVFLRRSLAGETTIVTPAELDEDGSLDLALFEDGRVASVSLVRPSGVDEYDRNVVHVVRRMPTFGRVPPALGASAVFRISYDSRNPAVGRSGPGPGRVSN